MAMKVGKYVQSRFLKGTDEVFEENDSVNWTVSHAEEETLMGEDKLIIYFEEEERGMVLNKTNTRRLIEAFGDDADEWVGKRVNLYTESVTFNGQTTDAIRLKKAKSQAAPVEQDSVPF